MHIHVNMDTYTKNKKTIIKMMDLHPSITIIMLNVNGIKPFERLRLSDKRKKQDLMVFYILLLETYTLNTKTQVG